MRHPLLFCLAFALMAPTAHAALEVVVGPTSTATSGRLLLFAQKADAKPQAPVTEVDLDAFMHTENFAAAREVRHLKPGAKLTIDGTDLAFPCSLDALPPGDYWVQAVLDVDHSYAYSGRGAGDVVSKVVKVSLPLRGKAPALLLDRTLPTPSLWELGGHQLVQPDEQTEVDARITQFSIESHALSTFMGRPMALRGLVVTPVPEPGTTYPVVYFTHGFGGDLHSLADTAVAVMRQTRAGRLPPLVWVLLDQSSPTGPHEFADSVNNGPWGTALTTELIPTLEARLPVDRQASSRFFMGHSSGGWAALWAQVTAPTLFGGCWVTAPDFTDFTDFEGIDLTKPNAVMTNLTYARIEAVLGETGGQASAFEWVFSPRGPDGRPMPLYDRDTGRVDPEVASFWKEHFDITQRLRARWSTLGPVLDGKLHVFVGTNDQFGMNRSVQHLERTLTELHGRGSFTYLEGKGHFDLYADGAERSALRRVMAWQMWQQARPHSPLRDPGPLPKG